MTGLVKQAFHVRPWKTKMSVSPWPFLPADEPPGRAGARQSRRRRSSGSGRSQTLNAQREEGFHCPGSTGPAQSLRLVPFGAAAD